MKIDFKEIKNMLQTENLSEVSRQTGTPLRTLENYKHGYNKSFENMEDTLTKLQTYIEENDKMKFKNLQAVNYYNGEYELEFNLDGELKYVTVDASDHLEAATDEDYFDNREVVEKIIAEN